MGFQLVSYFETSTDGPLGNLARNFASYLQHTVKSGIRTRVIIFSNIVQTGFLFGWRGGGLLFGTKFWRNYFTKITEINWKIGQYSTFSTVFHRFLPRFVRARLRHFPNDVETSHPAPGGVEKTHKSRVFNVVLGFNNNPPWVLILGGGDSGF